MNARGLFSSVKKRNDVFDWAKGKNTSIVCFQETHSTGFDINGCPIARGK